MARPILCGPRIIPIHICEGAFRRCLTTQKLLYVSLSNVTTKKSKASHRQGVSMIVLFLFEVGVIGKMFHYVCLCYDIGCEWTVEIKTTRRLTHYVSSNATCVVFVPHELTEFMFLLREAFFRASTNWLLVQCCSVLLCTTSHKNKTGKKLLGFLPSYWGMLNFLTTLIQLLPHPHFARKGELFFLGARAHSIEL